MGGGQKLSRLRRKIGAVLIEFAFAIPVFLVLTYYIHDLPKQKLMQRKMQFVANEMSAILQNIAMQKSLSGEKMTKKDLECAARLANLSIYPGITQYSTNNSFSAMPLGWLPLTHLFYIVGTGGENAEIKWGRRMYPCPINYFFDIDSNVYLDSVITKRSGVASSIHPNLKISKGEAKIILEYTVYHSWNKPSRNLFGFLFYSPQYVTKRGNELTYFTVVSIFSPASGAFSESAPQ